MRKTPKLKFKEMNRKQKAVFVLDWILKGILLALLTAIIIVGFVSCFDKEEVTASATTEEPLQSVRSIAYADAVGSPVALSLYEEHLSFNGTLSSFPYYSLSGSATVNQWGNFLRLYMTELPKIVFTIEVVDFLPDNCIYTIQYLKNGSLIRSCDFVGNFQVDPSFDYDTLLFILTNTDNQISSITFNITLYFYAGEYSPGYGQGLAAGIQQGYNQGYNQGSADTAKEYALSMFNGSSCYVGYTNDPSNLKYSDFTPVEMKYDGDIYFSNFPVLSETYYNYYLFIDFDTPFEVHEDTLLLTFANSLRLSSDGSVAHNALRVGFVGKIDDFSLPVLYFYEAIAYPLSGTNYTYSLRNMSDSVFPVMGNRFSGMIIQICSNGGGYTNLQSLRITTKASSNSSYYSGYTEGFNTGYKDGSSIGYTDGYNAGDSIGYDRGHTEGYQEGYDIGYEVGDANSYNRGHSDGFQEGFNATENGGFSWLISSVQQFFNTKFFGDFGVGTLVYVALGVTLVMLYLKFFAK